MEKRDLYSKLNYHLVKWILLKISPKTKAHIHLKSLFSGLLSLQLSESQNVRNISSNVISLAYMWCSVWLCSLQDTCHLQSRQPAASTIWPFLDLGSALRELLIHRTYLSSSQILHFLYLQSITGNNRMEYLIIWNRL